MCQMNTISPSVKEVLQGLPEISAGGVRENAPLLREIYAALNQGQPVCLSPKQAKGFALVREEIGHRISVIRSSMQSLSCRQAWEIAVLEQCFGITVEDPRKGPPYEIIRQNLQRVIDALEKLAEEVRKSETETYPRMDLNHNMSGFGRN